MSWQRVSSKPARSDEFGVPLPIDARVYVEIKPDIAFPIETEPLRAIRHLGSGESNGHEVVCACAVLLKTDKVPLEIPVQLYGPDLTAA